MRYLNYGMRTFNWVKDFEECRIMEDIPRRVEEAQISFWIWLMVSIVILGSVR